eukprot:gene37693-50886_t
MRILQVSAELFPLLKTGGLADIAGALPLALMAEGQDARPRSRPAGCLFAPRRPNPATPRRSSGRQNSNADRATRIRPTIAARSRAGTFRVVVRPRGRQSGGPLTHGERAGLRDLIRAHDEACQRHHPEARRQRHVRRIAPARHQHAPDPRRIVPGVHRVPAIAAIEALTEGPLVLVGSSMGGWISCLVAAVMPERLHAMVLIAPAADFTEALMKPGLPPEAHEALAHDGGPTEAFDNARRDVTLALNRAGFQSTNIRQFSVRPERYKDTQPQKSEARGIYAAMVDLSAK